jgi:hypothetical protein
VAETVHDSPDVHGATPASSEPLVEQHAWPSEPHALHVPAIPVARLRPAQPSPLVQEPLLLVPQQVWPDAPQAAHLSPVAETTQLKPAVHSVSPLQHG